MTSNSVTDAFSAYSNADYICRTIHEEFGLRTSIQVACICVLSGGAPTPAVTSMFSMVNIFTHTFLLFDHFCSTQFLSPHVGNVQQFYLDQIQHFQSLLLLFTVNRKIFVLQMFMLQMFMLRKFCRSGRATKKNYQI